MMGKVRTGMFASLLACVLLGIGSLSAHAVEAGYVGRMGPVTGFPKGAAASLQFTRNPALPDYVTFTRAGTSTATTSTSYLSATYGQSFASRASTGTYFDANGVMQTAAIDTERPNYALVSGSWVLRGTLVEPQRTNLIYPSIFDSSYLWARVTPTYNSGTAPDGTSTATMVAEQAVSNNHYWRPQLSIATTSGVSYTLSVFAKSGTLSSFQIALGSPYFPNTGYANFNLSTGQISTGASAIASMSSVGNGFYRCSVTVKSILTSTTLSGGVFAFINNDMSTTTIAPSYSGSASNNMYVWGAQLEAASEASSYISTSGVTATRSADYYYVGNATYTGSDGVIKYALHNQPRFDYNPSTLAPRGLLIEGQRTNYLLYSDDMSNEVWSYTNITTTSVSEGYKLTLTGATSLTHLFLQNSSITSGSTYTDYIVVKPNGYNYVQGSTSTGFSTGDYVNFNIANGTVGAFQVTGTAGNILSYGIQPMGNGFYMCWITASANLTSASGRLYWSVMDSDIAVRSPTFTANGTSGVIISRTQREVGTFPSSYIPTSSATATRSADSAIIANLPSIGHNQAQGTVYTEAELEGVGATGTFATPASFSNSSNSLISILFSNGGLRYKGYVYASGVEQANFFSGGTISPFSTVKLAFGFADNNMALYVNGSGASDMAGTIPQVSNLYIGSSYTSNQQLGGWIKKIVYYPTRLPDAVLQQMSQ